jgi:hypothetical protein
MVCEVVGQLDDVNVRCRRADRGDAKAAPDHVREVVTFGFTDDHVVASYGREH